MRLACMGAVSRQKRPSAVGDIMTRDVISVDENDDLAHLLESMRVLRFRHLPVTNDARLVGMLTERDVLSLSASSLLPNRSDSDEFLQKRYRVRDVMTENVISVNPNTSLREAGRLMLERRIGCLPVVDESNTLVGILTSTDFVELATQLVFEEIPGR